MFLIWSFGHFGHLVIWSFGHLVIWWFGHLVIGDSKSPNGFHHKIVFITKPPNHQM